MKAGLCYRCLKKGHISRGCCVTCTNCEVKIGSVVLMQDVNQPRLKWPLGIVTKLSPSRDDVVRTVEVRIAKGGKLVHSIPCIHDLEIVNDDPKCQSVESIKSVRCKCWPVESVKSVRCKFQSI